MEHGWKQGGVGFPASTACSYDGVTKARLRVDAGIP